MHNITVIDLFSGAGGLSLGFKLEGYKCLTAIEIDPVAARTYAKNLEEQIVCDTVSTVTELPNVDVIIGGPPCQGFSSAGSRQDDDCRNTLVRTFGEIIAQHRPRAFVFENVEGFLTSAKGDRVFDLLDPVIEAGYRVHLRKVNAANYGVPQHRKRVIGIGCLGFDPIFPEPTHMAFGAPGTANLYRNLPHSPTLADALRGLPPANDSPPGIPSGHFARQISTNDAERISLLKPGQRMRDLPERLWHDTYKKRAFRRVMDGTPSAKRGGPPSGVRRLEAEMPSKAITSGASSEFVHPIEDRYLTLRECARIQTFPDSFIFEGTITQVRSQIANAVPPVLARAIAASLRHDLLVVQQPVFSEGALLSFVPTLSNGMSPLLAQVSDRIYERFLSNNSQSAEQLMLWR